MVKRTQEAVRRLDEQAEAFAKRAEDHAKDAEDAAARATGPPSTVRAMRRATTPGEPSRQHGRPRALRSRPSSTA